MYRSILVPLDGSAFSEHALPVAHALARASGATLHLVLVHVTPVPHTLTSVPKINVILDAELRTEEQAYLDALPARLGADPQLRLEPVQLNGLGAIADVLAEFAATNGVDLVVMTTHGRGGLTRLWLGSTAYSLAHRCEVPLLLIRPTDTPPDLTAARSFQHIAVPLDGSPLAEQVLEPTLGLAQLVQAECTLLHVVEPLMLPGYAPAAYVAQLDVHTQESLRHDAEQYLEATVRRIESQGVPLHTRVVFATHPATGIFHAADSEGLDLIAMAIHGRSGLARVLLGSVTDKVVRGAEIPVLVYRPKAARA